MIMMKMKKIRIMLCAGLLFGSGGCLFLETIRDALIPPPVVETCSLLVDGDPDLDCLLSHF